MSSSYSSKLLALLQRSRWVWLVVLPLWVALVFFVSVILVSFTVALLQITGVQLHYQNNPLLQLTLSIVTYGLMLSILIGVSRWTSRRPTNLKVIGLSRLMTYSDIGWALVGFVVYALLATLALTLATTYLPWFDPKQAQDIGLTSLGVGVEPIIALVLLVVFTPLVEELIFRGYLYGKLRARNIPAWAVMLVVSVIFAAAHGQWNVALDTFALSLVLTALRERTGSIWAGVLIHMIKNAVAFYLLYVAPMSALMY